MNQKKEMPTMMPTILLFKRGNLFEKQYSFNCLFYPFSDLYWAEGITEITTPKDS